MATETVVSTSVLRGRLTRARSEGAEVGFVPTMGFLHAGHATLIERAAAENDLVVVSIFVNPTQFAPGEDLDAYPRDLDGDVATVERAGGHLVFVPTVQEMYPGGLASDAGTWVTVEGPSRGLCAGDRPTHFRGVTTVVARLFNKVQPDRAYFGEKDYQQLAVIRQMVRDLDFPVEVRGVPIVREPDGLAMSSRNAYLSPRARADALGLSRGLRAAAARWAGGERRVAPLVGAVRAEMEKIATAEVQYVELVDPETLAAFEGEVPEGHAAQLAVAARIDGVRLIDNLRLGTSSK